MAYWGCGLLVGVASWWVWLESYPSVTDWMILGKLGDLGEAT